MSGLISRKPFLEETATLFTDEKVANARTKIIEWLNDTANGETSQKCEALTKIQEIILNSHIELLEEFIENILSFAHDTSQEVRRAVVGFIEQICKVKIDFVPRVINVFAMLLRDTSPQVIKRVIQACASIYKNTLQWLCSTIDITDSVENSWNTLCLMKVQILDMIDHDNDGIRTNAVKFLEGIVILQTYPDEDSMKRENDFSLEDIPMTLKLARRRKLEDEAINIFDCLLKFHAAVHISSVNLIACTGTICTIAKMRPTLMNPVIDAIKNLHSNLPPTLTDSQVSSVRKHLKMQLLNLLKNRASFEMQTLIITLLQDLGATQQEIIRSIPKMDKQEQQRRMKRALENAASTSSAQPLMKKPRFDKDSLLKSTTDHHIQMEGRPMEIDYDELDEQKLKSTKLNEKFIADNLKNIDNVIQLLIGGMNNLPTAPPEHFLTNYTPIVNMSINQQIVKISTLLAEQMSEQKIGPGSVAFTKETPMRPCVTLDEEKMIIQAGRKEPIPEIEKEFDCEIFEEDDDEMGIDGNDDNQIRKDKATKKLRETIERAKGEQALIQRMIQRVKTLKLQEVTKPLSRNQKEQFMLDAAKRILRSERQCIIGGVSAKRRKILTVMAATFPEIIREQILEFIMLDIKNRIDLAFSWLYEEYCLLQGFTRHSYVKTEHSPDYSYNKLLKQLINGIIKRNDFKERIILLRRIYLESPLLSDESISQLIQMCQLEDISYNCLELIKDLTIRRPPRKLKFLRILLTYSVHENQVIREKSLENVISLYAVNKVLTNKIEEFALEWLGFLEAETPPASICKIEYGRPEVYQVWNEDLAKICLTVFLVLMPYREDLIQNLSRIYITTSADMKRTILRTIEVSIKKMGSECSEILNLIEQCPKGVETLVTRIIYILTEKQQPTAELVSKVRELYKTKVTDVRILIPILSGLTKKEILNALPKFLKLNPIVVKEVFNRLLGIGNEFSNQTIPITPTELLIALHTMDITKCELKFIVKATSLCLAEKDVYTQDVLASCLQQLVEIIPIPTLLMRTVIQSLTLYPRLSGFVINLLQRLILKQVWKQKVIWDGFLKCCQKLKPQSLPVLIQLPGLQLQDALLQCPDLRQPLINYAETITESQVGQVSNQTMDILTGNTQDVFVTDETGGYMLLDNIKKEREDPAIIDVLLSTTTGQPLPPGEDQ